MQDFDRPRGITAAPAPNLLTSTANARDSNSDSDSDDGWESVQKKKNTSLVKVTESKNRVLSRDAMSRNTSQATEKVGSSGWAKIASGNPRRLDAQFHEGEHLEWASYGRDIRVRRDPAAVNKIVEKNEVEDDGW